MAESSLSIQKSDIDQAVARYLGLTTVLADLDATEQAIRFYAERDWVMLEPLTTLDTTVGEFEVALPDDFGGIVGSMHHAPNTGYRTLKEVGVGDIINFRSDSLNTSIPEYVAFVPEATDGSTGQRWKALFYPTPDATYELTYQYTRFGDDLLNADSYPPGGAIHRNTIIEACLSAAENRNNDSMGLHEQRYQMRLAQSIAADNRVRPANIGYCGDGPTRMSLYPRTFAKYNGSVPT